MDSGNARVSLEQRLREPSRFRREDALSRCNALGARFRSGRNFQS
jgi:hypothetical protein